MTTRELYRSEQLITPPVMEPIDLDEVKRHLRFTTGSEDTLLDTYIAAARGHFEEQTGRQVMAATWEEQFEGFPVTLTDRPYPGGLIELRHPPLLGVLSITLPDGSSPEPTLIEGTDFEVDISTGPYARPGVVRPIAGGAWSSATSGVGSVRIRYRAGYGEVPGDVPELVKATLYFLVGHFHKFRAEVYEGAPGSSIQAMPIGAETFLRAFKYSALPSQPPLRTTWA